MDDLDIKELTRYQSVQHEWEVAIDFLDWLKEKDIILAERYGPERIRATEIPVKEFLADFYNIDLIEVAREKEDVVEQYLGHFAKQPSM